MSWPLLFALVFGLGFALLVVLARRASLARMRGTVREIDRAVRQGSAKAQFQYPGATPELVPEAVLRGVAGLAGFDVYAAGPPAMIDAVRHELPRQGADPARIYFDSFDRAPV